MWAVKGSGLVVLAVLPAGLAVPAAVLSAAAAALLPVCACVDALLFMQQL